jgi:hypothetical protein
MMKAFLKRITERLHPRVVFDAKYAAVAIP